jgi:hypothetical protein
MEKKRTEKEWALLLADFLSRERFEAAWKDDDSEMMKFMTLRYNQQVSDSITQIADQTCCPVCTERSMIQILGVIYVFGASLKQEAEGKRSEVKELEKLFSLDPSTSEGGGSVS